MTNVEISVVPHLEPFPYILIDNLYTEEEESLIKKELDFLLPSLSGPEHTGTARDQEGTPLKSNKGIFLDMVYTNRDYSYILKINRKIFSILHKVQQDAPLDNWFFKFQQTDNDTTLLSYYENSDHYKKHQDTALYTVLTWFYNEPKSYTGGNLHFPDYNLDFECKNNKTIVFPSMIFHEVDEITLEEDKKGQGLGRWCLTQFASKQH